MKPKVAHIAAALRVSTQTMYRYRALGCPLTSIGKALEWREKNIAPARRKEERLVQPGSNRDELYQLKSRLLRAQVEREEAALALARGDLVTVESVDREARRAAAIVRAAWDEAARLFAQESAVRGLDLVVASLAADAAVRQMMTKVHAAILSMEETER